MLIGDWRLFQIILSPMAASHHGDCTNYVESFPPNYSKYGASMLQPCHGTRAKDTPRSGKWNANQCPPCRTGHEKTRRIGKREEKKEKTEEKEILRQLVLNAATREILREYNKYTIRI